MVHLLVLKKEPAVNWNANEICYSHLSLMLKVSLRSVRKLVRLPSKSMGTLVDVDGEDSVITLLGTLAGILSESMVDTLLETMAGL